MTTPSKAGIQISNNKSFKFRTTTVCWCLRFLVEVKLCSASGLTDPELRVFNFWVYQSVNGAFPK